MAKHQRTWGDAKRICRLNDDDIAMAQALGFRPDSLVRAMPNRKQQWKLPVKEWIHELHLERFGYIRDEKKKPSSPPQTRKRDDEAARYEAELHWEDYWGPNADAPPANLKPGSPSSVPVKMTRSLEITDDDIPF